MQRTPEVSEYLSLFPFDAAAKKVIANAIEFGRDSIGTEHLLQALIEDFDVQIILPTLYNPSFSIKQVSEAIELYNLEKKLSEEVGLSPRAKDTLNTAEFLRIERNLDRIRPIHLVGGLLEVSFNQINEANVIFAMAVSGQEKMESTHQTLRYIDKVRRKMLDRARTNF